MALAPVTAASAVLPTIIAALGLQMALDAPRLRLLIEPQVVAERGEHDEDRAIGLLYSDKLIAIK